MQLIVELSNVSVSMNIIRCEGAIQIVWQVIIVSKTIPPVNLIFLSVAAIYEHVKSIKFHCSMKLEGKV